MNSAPYKNCHDHHDISAFWRALWRVTAELIWMVQYREHPKANFATAKERILQVLDVCPVTVEVIRRFMIVLPQLSSAQLPAWLGILSYKYGSERLIERLKPSLFGQKGKFLSPWHSAHPDDQESLSGIVFASPALPPPYLVTFMYNSVINI